MRHPVISVHCSLSVQNETATDTSGAWCPHSLYSWRIVHTDRQHSTVIIKNKAVNVEFLKSGQCYNCRHEDIVVKRDTETSAYPAVTILTRNWRWSRQSGTQTWTIITSSSSSSSSWPTVVRMAWSSLPLTTHSWRRRRTRTSMTTAQWRESGMCAPTTAAAVLDATLSSCCYSSECALYTHNEPTSVSPSCPLSTMITCRQSHRTILPRAPAPYVCLPAAVAWQKYRLFRF